ncbi:MAG: carboxypeptidase regulatory-like domain-containing protein, partial [Planctomycetota bacterium]
EVDHGGTTPFSSADGRFRLRRGNWTPGEVRVRVTAKGRAPTTVRTRRDLNLPDDVCIVRLPRGCTIVGEVRDAETSTPIVGAVVTLVNDRAMMMPDSSGPATDAEGKFRLTDVSVGEHQLLIERVGYPPRYFGPVRVEAPGDEIAISPTLHRGVTVRGRVIGATDPGSVKILGLLVARGATVEARIDPSGQFELPGIPPGSLRLAVSDRGGPWRTRVIEVTSAGAVDVRVDLTPGPAHLQVSVRSSVGPMKNGSIRLTSIESGERHTVLVENGVAAIDGLPSGTFRVEVRPGTDLEPSSREIDLKAGLNELEFVLQRRD